MVTNFQEKSFKYIIAIVNLSLHIFEIDKNLLEYISEFAVFISENEIKFWKNIEDNLTKL